MPSAKTCCCRASSFVACVLAWFNKDVSVLSIARAQRSASTRVAAKKAPFLQQWLQPVVQRCGLAGSAQKAFARFENVV